MLVAELLLECYIARRLKDENGLFDVYEWNARYCAELRTKRLKLGSDDVSVLVRLAYHVRKTLISRYRFPMITLSPLELLREVYGRLHFFPLEV